MTRSICVAVALLLFYPIANAAPAKGAKEVDATWTQRDVRVQCHGRSRCRGAEAPDDLRPACKRLKAAVAVYDVNATVPREDVRRWNAVIRASRQLRQVAGCVLG